MKRVFFVLAIALVGCDTSNNILDPIDSYFVRYYGTNGEQEGADMHVNSDGTILLLGTSMFEGELGQIYLVKVDARGDVLWEKFYTATSSLTAMDIEPIVDGNYVILSNSVNTTSGTDFHIFTIDGDGVELNSSDFTYGGLSDEVGITITPIVDGSAPAGFIVAGSTNYDPAPNDNSANGFEKTTALFVRFNADCSLYSGVWTKYKSANGYDYCTKAIQVGDLTSAYPFRLFGYTNSNPTNTSFNFWSTPMNNFGSDQVFENGIIEGSPTTTDERLGSVTVLGQPQFGNYLLAGISTNNTGSDNIFIATSQLSLTPPKSITEIDLGDISALGNRSFEKVTAYPSSGGLIIAANTVLNGNSDIVLTKVSTSGNLVWDNPVFFGGSGDDYECSVYELGDGRLLVFGTMEIGDDDQKKMALIKSNKNGKFSR